MSENTVIDNVFETGAELADALADAVAGNLRDAIAERGAAVLAVSGGSTPEVFFRELSDKELDWSLVTILPVDERWVDETNPRSNARLIHTMLLREWARAANFVPLFADTDTPKEGLAGIEEDVAGLPRPFDVVVLGMGTDGHTASFFPEGDNLAEALNPAGEKLVLPIRAEGADEPRVTLTLPVIAEARQLYLHIEGKKKRTVLQKAMKGGSVEKMPVRAVLRNDRKPVIYWAP